MQNARTPEPRLLRLRCAVQHYEWGRPGDDSLVARLSGEAIPDPTRPYAELWMGTHPSAPSSLRDDGGGLLLSEWLARNPEALGPAVSGRWGGDLPFLLKVLSGAKALSLGAHPDKKLAETLHAVRPVIYKNGNHKPEMAIAVTEFRALCGFASVEELKDVLRTIPEIEELVGHKDACKLMTLKESDENSEIKSSLQSAFTNLMTASIDMISEVIAKLISRLNSESKGRTLTEKERLVLSLERQYHGDVGVLAALFLNDVKLSPGEALYIAPNEPHAYISGECIECMAASDNVARAGLTSKHRDVETFCSMLTYKQIFPEILRGDLVQPNVRRYAPPCEEFELDCCSVLPAPGELLVLPPIPGPSIFLVLAGEGRVQVDPMSDGEEVNEGDVFFVPAYTDVKLSACGTESMQLYRAGINSSCFE